MLFFVLILTPKYFNTVLYKGIQDDAIFHVHNFLFLVLMLSSMDVNALSNSESVAISLVMEWEIL